MLQYIGASAEGIGGWKFIRLCKETIQMLSFEVCKPKRKVKAVHSIVLTKS